MFCNSHPWDISTGGGRVTCALAASANNASGMATNGVRSEPVAGYFKMSRSLQTYRLWADDRIASPASADADQWRSALARWHVGIKPIGLKGHGLKQCGMELRISEIVESVMSDTSHSAEALSAIRYP
jgi:hypothetical protein